MNNEFLNNLDSYIREKRYRLINAVLVYENGALVFERYYNNCGAESRNQIKSVWKSIISIAVGICLGKGLINDIDDPISMYLPQFAQNIHPYHKSIKIRHLLTMSSGIYWNGGIHYHCPMLDQMLRARDWIAHIADVRPAHPPGEKFVYKEWDAILLSAIIGKVCGSAAGAGAGAGGGDVGASDGASGVGGGSGGYDVGGGGGGSDASRIGSGRAGSGSSGSVSVSAGAGGGAAWDICYEYLYKPLEIKSERWTQSKCGVDYPSWGEDKSSDLSARDMAKIGLLMLRGGQWDDGRQIIPRQYIKKAIAPSEAYNGYGYLFWLTPGGYHARGFGGQELNIYPEKNIVAVIQATVTPSSKSYSDISNSLVHA